MLLGREEGCTHGCEICRTNYLLLVFLSKTRPLPYTQTGRGPRFLLHPLRYAPFVACTWCTLSPCRTLITDTSHARPVSCASACSCLYPLLLWGLTYSSTKPNGPSRRCTVGSFCMNAATSSRSARWCCLRYLVLLEVTHPVHNLCDRSRG